VVFDYTKKPAGAGFRRETKDRCLVTGDRLYVLGKVSLAKFVFKGWLRRKWF